MCPASNDSSSFEQYIQVQMHPASTHPALNTSRFRCIQLSMHPALNASSFKWVHLQMSPALNKSSFKKVQLEKVQLQKSPALNASNLKCIQLQTQPVQHWTSPACQLGTILNKSSFEWAQLWMSPVLQLSSLYIWIPWRFTQHLNCGICCLLGRHSIPDSIWKNEDNGFWLAD